MKRLPRILLCLGRIPKHLCLAVWYGLRTCWCAVIMHTAVSALFLAGLLVGKTYFNKVMSEIFDG